MPGWVIRTRVHVFVVGVFHFCFLRLVQEMKSNPAVLALTLFLSEPPWIFLRLFRYFLFLLSQFVEEKFIGVEVCRRQDGSSVFVITFCLKYRSQDQGRSTQLVFGLAAFEASRLAGEKTWILVLMERQAVQCNDFCLLSIESRKTGRGQFRIRSVLLSGRARNVSQSHGQSRSGWGLRKPSLGVFASRTAEGVADFRQDRHPALSRGGVRCQGRIGRFQVGTGGHERYRRRVGERRVAHVHVRLMLSAVHGSEHAAVFTIVRRLCTCRGRFEDPGVVRVGFRRGTRSIKRFCFFSCGFARFHVSVARILGSFAGNFGIAQGKYGLLFALGELLDVNLKVIFHIELLIDD